MRLVVLYEELAGYLIACINRFAEKYNAQVHIFRKELNEVAPFDFNLADNLKIYDRKNLDDEHFLEIIEKIKPDGIFCGGWIYKPYLKLAKKYRNEIPVILGFDNKWENSIKQNTLSLFSKRYFQRHFSSCWVPGDKQAEFARRIGFSKNKIFQNAYSADVDLFEKFYKNSLAGKRQNIPTRFIFSGRYTHAKGIDLLWQAFIELQKENPNDWELWCLGAGDVEPIIHPKIKHFGFVQPNDMGNIIRDCGVFVLPSTFEPWGVAVHEFAAAGFPLICSDEVGAAELFLKDGENGFLFESGNSTALKTAMKKILSMNDQQLFAMGEMSTELAQQITPDKWADTLMSILNIRNKN